MPCKFRRNMANDPSTKLFVIIEHNGSLELKGFLKHDHFTYKPTQFTSLIKKKHFGIQIFKTMKRKKPKTKELAFYLVLISVQFLKTRFATM